MRIHPFFYFNFPKMTSIFGIFPTIWLSPFLLLLIAFLAGNEACELRVKVKSQTNTPFQFKMVNPEKGIEMEQFEFEGQGEKEMQINAPNCGETPWKLMTNRREADGNWALAREASAKLDGNGLMEVKIGDELQPSLGARVGVFCAESLLCH